MTASVQAPPTPRPTDLAQSWGWSLLWLFLIILIGAMVLIVVRRLTLGGRASLGRGGPRRRPTDTTSAWEEAGRRMAPPEPPPNAPDLREEP